MSDSSTVQGMSESSRVRRIEAVVLVLIFLLLAVATVADVRQRVNNDHRLLADLNTWRAVSGHEYHNLSIEQNKDGRGTREVVCGNTAPGAPKVHVRLCLIMSGPTHDVRRAAHGGYYLPPLLDDVRTHRYACFGSAKRSQLCGEAAPATRKVSVTERLDPGGPRSAKRG
ncbi:MAG TPA: hypothetical protein VLJ42_13790 [Solirubrobacteraceae bacterium]|nr:hypothetical protein [Solirubrobacteraceae bacterium]